ncbi:MAG: histone deacetylase [Acidobacteriota bacterium]
MENFYKYKNKLMFPLVYSEKYWADIGSHVFPVQKFKMIKERLIKEDLVKIDNFIEPDLPFDEDILLAHTSEWLNKLKNGLLTVNDIIRLELPYDKSLSDWFLYTSGGTILTSKLALKNRVGFHIGGGFHHAFADHGEGFCALNDIAIALLKLKKEGLIKKGMVVDCDVHQGNGTAAIFKKDVDIFTFSIHQGDNYPAIKEKSDIDVELYSGEGDEKYLNILRNYFPKLYKELMPEIIIYVAGADPYKEDQLGGLELTKEGLMERDRLVIGEALKLNIPVAVVLGGGYAFKVEDTVEIHINTIKICNESMEKLKN